MLWYVWLLSGRGKGREAGWNERRADIVVVVEGWVYPPTHPPMYKKTIKVINKINSESTILSPHIVNIIHTSRWTTVNVFSSRQVVQVKLFAQTTVCLYDMRYIYYHTTSNSSSSHRIPSYPAAVILSSFYFYPYQSFFFFPPVDTYDTYLHVSYHRTGQSRDWRVIGDDLLLVGVVLYQRGKVYLLFFLLLLFYFSSH